MKNIILTIIIISIFVISKLNAQNYSLNFDGTNDKVVIPNNIVLNTLNEITVEAWINANEWKPQHWAGTIVGKDGDASSVSTGFVLRAGNNGILSFVLTPGWLEVTSLPIMKTGKWYHVAGVYDGANVKLYINGVLQSSKEKTDQITNSNFDLLIGESPGFSGRVFNGKIDEVRIWNIARTQSEIQQNMSESLLGNELGLVAYYNFDDGPSSNIVTDLTSNTLNGTLTNMDASTDWLTGYFESVNDVGVTSISSPFSSPQWNNTMRVKVDIKNFAFNDISNFDVTYSCNGIVVTETVTATISAFETYTYTFNSFIDLSDVNNAEISAWTNLSGDTDNSNDLVTQTMYSSNILTVFDAEQHNFSTAGQVHTKTIYLPDNLDNYSQILMHINLTCPTSGCDPWDQPAKITLIKGEQSYEIGRYVTPYGKACGPWTVDITDFKSLLTGKSEIQSYIQVWGSSGWLLTLEFEFIEETPQYQYSKLTNLWNEDYWIYGDPAISHDLPEQIIQIENNTLATQVRMTNSGHGQANTSNAAEFSNFNHHLWANGTETFEHHLWKSDCNVNTCSPQNGTWTYARAGWCPGQQVTPVWWNLDGLFNAGNDLSLDYVLQDYTNLLNTGYNGSSHTEPHYRIHSYLIEYSNLPFNDFVNSTLSEITSPVNGNPTPGNNETVTINITNSGTLPISNFDVGYYVNDGIPVIETILNEILPGNSLNYSFSQTADLSQTTYSELVAFTNLTNDNNSFDDAARIWFGQPLIVNEVSDIDFDIFPNPANDYLFLNIKKTINPCILTITDLLGKVVYSEIVIINSKIDISSFNSGFYLVIVESEESSFTKKLIIK